MDLAHQVSIVLLSEVPCFIVVFNRGGVLISNVFIHKSLVVCLPLRVYVKFTRWEVSLVDEGAVHFLQVLLHELFRLFHLTLHLLVGQVFC